MLKTIVMLIVSFGLFPAFATAMSPDGCGAGVCAECHSLSKKEAQTLLDGIVDQVIDVKLAEIPGMWMVEVEKDNRKLPIYVDFSKNYLLSGNIIRLSDRGNVTQEQHARMNKVDISRIPLDDALVLGRESAQNRVIVFTDPECPYCKKLHTEMQEVVRREPNIAFYIKMFPLKMHPNAYNISKSIVCNKSMELLEASFAGKPIPPPLCETTVIDQTIALVQDLGIRSTPTIVLPDGLVLPGYKSAEELLARIGQSLAKTE
ncbi:MAG: DsbC family protein [Deltaproteobacteria bacterium]|jgi:thiol:disulfide interchange protein DsbC|nr:DsbC family protein [Deltaproteobacteria bacterium]